MNDLKTLEEAKIIARSSDPDWVGEELFRLQGLAAKAEQLRRRVAELEAGIRGVLDRFDLSARGRLEALLPGNSAGNDPAVPDNSPEK